MIVGVLLGLGLLLVHCTAEGNVKRATLETCGGCRLNSLPKVKNFINHHLPQYADLDIKYIGGKDPEMVFYDEAGSEVERVLVMQLSEDDIIALLAARNIYKKPSEL